jgi:hypothetical protein
MVSIYLTFIHINPNLRFVGGIDETTGAVFFEIVESRDQETLYKVLTKHIISGSILVVDEWKGYRKARKVFDHATVNHSENFVDPETGHHTQRIESNLGLCEEAHA